MSIVRGTGIGSDVDAYFKFNGANASTNFYDDSQSKKTVTAYGNAQISTSQSKFGGSSLYLDGTGDYLTLPTTDLLFVSGAEKSCSFWFYAIDVTQNRVLIGTRKQDDAPNIGQAVAIYDSNIVFQTIVGLTTYSIVGTTTLVNNTWYHIRLTKTTADLFTLYLNGVSEGNITSSGVLPTLSPLNIGYCEGGAYTGEFNGYIDDLIIQSSIDYITNPTRQRG